MTTVQERLKQSRIPLDKWSVREQLCLASAVSCSGDQNWMSVSRTLKVVCSTTGANSVPRPADWYSQKSCAVQYGNLLENVETPKRKKRTSESSGTDTPTSVETPTDLVLRKLTEERMQELKNEISKDQEEYVKLYKEIKELQAGNVAEERLLAMWKEMEEQEEDKRLEKIKLEKEMHEREQRKLEMQRSWRVVPPVANVKTETATVIEDTAELAQKPKILQLPTDTTTQPQTSPLLSSLLKSPTSNAPTVHVTSVARSTAPTITTLLTGGSIPIKQPVVIINNTDVGQMLTRPASGPPTETVNMSQTVISPSQSAPTLSMLLEKNKTNAAQNSPTAVIDVKLKNEQMDEDQQTIKSNNDIAPIEVDDVVIESHEMDVDETDPNEEQQLLEVFKNIGNIEMEIDAEFLTVMNEEPPNEHTDLAVTFENKIEATTTATVPENTATVEEDKKNKVEIVEEKQLVDENSTVEQEEQVEEKIEDKSKETAIKPEVVEQENKTEVIKVETSSSDDSSDNVPLSTVATVLEVKEQEKTETQAVEELKEQEQVQEDVITAADKKEECVEMKTEDITSYIKEELETANEDEQYVVQNQDVEENTVKTEDEKDILNEVKAEDNTIEKEENKTLAKEEDTKLNKVEEDVDMQVEVIPITDTDTDSSCTPEVEKNVNLAEKNYTKIERVKPERLVSEDSDSTTISATPALPPTVTPARPPALRKLRERDRSESPMIGEDDFEHGTATSLRLRRRASSTPLIDSIPNSPASMSDREDRELRTAYKKSLLSIYNIMQQKHARYISLLENSFSKSSPSNVAKYEEVCLRPMDFQVIRQNIENGSIRNTLELQRDILLMCQNALMLYPAGTEQHSAAMHIKQDCRNISDMCQMSSDKDIKKDSRNSVGGTNTSTPIAPNTSASKSRSGFRKSQRII